MVFVVMFLMDADILTLSPWFQNEIQEDSKLYAQVYTVIVVGVAYVLIYSFFLFRKTLRYFQKVKPFDQKVIRYFNTIGMLLSISGLTASVLTFLSRLVFKNSIEINLGITPYLFLICLGLFFMVLSEVFKVAKHAKEENELTV
jgi:membrane protease YdiL (CAAX protease family)